MTSTKCCLFNIFHRRIPFALHCFISTIQFRIGIIDRIQIVPGFIAFALKLLDIPLDTCIQYISTVRTFIPERTLTVTSYPVLRFVFRRTALQPRLISSGVLPLIVVMWIPPFCLNNSLRVIACRFRNTNMHRARKEQIEISYNCHNTDKHWDSSFHLRNQFRVIIDIADDFIF